MAGRLDDHVARRPDKTLAFKSRMPLLYNDTDTTAATYTCPMHPDAVSTEPGTYPQCGMKLVPAPAATAEGAPTHEHHHHEGHLQGHDHDAPDGLEWEDLMPEINAASNAHNMIWQLVDVDTGKQNWEIDWAFRVGDRSRSLGSRTANKVTQGRWFSRLGVGRGWGRWGRWWR